MHAVKDQIIALNVRLKPSESSTHPRATNFTNVGLAQGIAYLDVGFIEPTLPAAIAKTAKDGQTAVLSTCRECGSKILADQQTPASKY